MREERGDGETGKLWAILKDIDMEMTKIDTKIIWEGMGQSRQTDRQTDMRYLYRQTDTDRQI